MKKGICILEVLTLFSIAMLIGDMISGIYLYGDPFHEETPCFQEEVKDVKIIRVLKDVIQTTGEVESLILANKGSQRLTLISPDYGVCCILDIENVFYGTKDVQETMHTKYLITIQKILQKKEGTNDFN